MKAKHTNENSYNELLQSISKLAEGMQQLALEAVMLYTPIVENIIKTKSIDVKHIEHTLDQLLDFCFHEQMLLLFKRLCRYYYTVDPQSTAEYIYIYRDMWDSDEEEKTIN